jgi:trimethylamine---corrinoid protein Co-methyltransferase
MKFSKNFTVLSQDEIQMIHEKVLKVLWEVGIMVEEKESLQLLEKNGAKADYELMRAYMPKELVEHALEVKGHTYTMYDSLGNAVAQFDQGDETFYGTCGYSTTYVDKEGVEHEGAYADTLRLAKLFDTIDEFTIFEPSIQPCDMPAELQDLYMVKAALVGTKKPIHTVANSEENLEGIVELLAEVQGGVEEVINKPHLILNLCTFSPLGIRKDCCEVIRGASKYNIPCMFSVGTMAGATAPVTLAGSLVEAFAEVIGHIVLTQCYKPGHPCGMLSASRAFDMKFAACTVATPEYPVLKIASTQLAKFYKIPIGTVGFTGDSNEFDIQCGWEKMMNALATRQAGANCNLGVGMYSQLNQFSFEELAIDAEIVKVIERIGRGLEVTEDSLAFDVIKKEGVKAEFLMNPHTLSNFKSELMTPLISDRMPYPNYLKREGKNNIVERAAKQVAKYEKSYKYTKGQEHEEALQKIIDKYARK